MNLTTLPTIDHLVAYHGDLGLFVKEILDRIAEGYSFLGVEGDVARLRYISLGAGLVHAKRARERAFVSISIMQRSIAEMEKRLLSVQKDVEEKEKCPKCGTKLVKSP